MIRVRRVTSTRTVNKVKRFKSNESKKSRQGENNPNWKGGVRKLGPYVYIQQKHPRAIYYGQTPYVMRAVVNLEKKIGRRLKKSELPHHDDGVKTHDAPSNLKVMTHAEHKRHHSLGKSNEERAKIKRVKDSQQTTPD